VLGAAGEAKAGSKPKAEPKPAVEAAPSTSSSKDERRVVGDGEVASPRPQPSPPARPAAPAKDARAAQTGASAPVESSPAPSGVRASPLARKVATERGVDLRSIRGTGPGGRIVEKDVDGAGGAAPKPAAAATPATKLAPAPAAGRRELSRTRKTTAKRMTDAKREIPHFYASADLAMDEAVRVREGLVALGGAFEGVTVTHLLVKAVGVALRRVPEMNASPDVDGVVIHEHVHVGIATATEQGLLVPVVRDVDRAAMAEVVAAARAVVGRARAGKPAGDDLSGATFTISNLGMFPVSHFAAVVNPPQAAILAVGTTRDVPVVRDGAVVPGKLMTVTLSCDHRVVDGALAGKFLAELKALVENPIALLV